jgi:hypothetical protein
MNSALDIVTPNENQVSSQLRKTVKATFKNALKYGKFLFAEFQRNQ